VFASGTDDQVTRTRAIEIGRTAGLSERFEEKKTEVRGTGPKRPMDIGRGALETKGVTDEMYGKRAPHTTLRIAITRGKTELRRIAHRRALVLDRELRVQLDKASEEYEELNKARVDLQKNMNKMIKEARKGEKDILDVVEFAVGKKSAGLKTMQDLIGTLERDKGIRSTEVTGDSAANMITEQFKRLDVAERRMYEEMRKQARGEEMYTELHSALTNEADRISQRIVWRLRLNADFRSINYFWHTGFSITDLGPPQPGVAVINDDTRPGTRLRIIAPFKNNRVAICSYSKGTVLADIIS